MAKRDPYFVPRRGGDASGPLIRWAIILGLTAGGAALAYHYISAEQGAPPAIEVREAAPLPPQYAESEPQSASDQTALDAASAGSEATAASGGSASDAQTAEPPLSEPASAPAPEPRPRPRRRPPPLPEPTEEPTPPPTANFPVTPPVDNPTPPPPT
jgi:hypothetical protein